MQSMLDAFGFDAILVPRAYAGLIDNCLEFVGISCYVFYRCVTEAIDEESMSIPEL